MVVNTGTVLTTTQGSLGSLELTEGTLGEATLLRSRGNLLIVCEPNAATDVEVVGLGIAVVTAAALGVGGLSLPGPIADQGFDGWLWHQYVPFDSVSLTAGDPQAMTVNARVEIDAKAMRKLPVDYAIVLIGELSTGDMGTVTVTGGLRFLLGS